MRIGPFSEKTGFSIDTLRYYETIGLMPPPARDAGGARDYSDDHLRWAAFLDVLKSTGMGVKDMSRYAALRTEGAATLPERLALLTAHREVVAAERRRLEATEKTLDEKIRLFRSVLDGSAGPDALACASGDDE